jgi:Tfp pilus assembly protein PilV
MLLRTVFLLALLAVLGETIVHGAASFAQAALAQRALDAARVAFVSGMRTAQTSIAQTLAANPQTSIFAAPAPIATCAYADTSGCEIEVQTTFAARSAAPAPSPSSCPATACTIVLQSNSAVSEARASFVVSSVVVSAASGATLASRSGIIAFRTFATPPYASIVGGTDATLDALINGGAGDDAGAPNTLIAVEYDASGGGSSTAGNVWLPVIENPASAAPAWDR